MDAAELEQWQSALPTDRDELELILEQLQADWIEAEAALLAAIQHGSGDIIHQVITVLGQQIRIIEDRLLS
ncbi:hypothetical protein E7T09_20390 [Deinococcus sp. KSM4-11]|uniref:hypothetical protein n=1 Tax=Deinococcus sp. KSM4-11 TaxID=2568654 RepID=UPI0010A37CCF|nr:hypothetical protein [Deinococcus sp. KSM4-11]THF84366.1 hypothetical protein E7T09_20390 [Deinococcus sp. KSM4-11]